VFFEAETQFVYILFLLLIISGFKVFNFKIRGIAIAVALFDTENPDLVELRSEE
jgi:hypothetical protein